MDPAFFIEKAIATTNIGDVEKPQEDAMTARIFIDGEVGTTGLQIKQRLEGRADIELVSLPYELRKDTGARSEALNSVDLVVLCLPDDAAREAVALIDNPDVRVVDASTAHRTAADWTYGFPEFGPDQRAAIAASKRVSNPGCYALTAIAMLHPLVKQGLLPSNWPVTINAISGYSGGGRKLIERFEDANAADHTDSAFFVYGLSLQHKHLPEITQWSGLARSPVFVPSVGRYMQGMLVQLPLPLWALPAKPPPSLVHSVLTDHYQGERFVQVPPVADLEMMTELDPEALNGTNELRLHVFASSAGDQVVVMGLIDNLSKGASGQAVQNLNIMLGLPEEAGLV